MTKEQTEACEKLEKIKTQEVHDKFTNEEYEQNTRIAWFQIGLQTGFQAAQSPEMLLLNPLVKGLVEALEKYSDKSYYSLYEDIDWSDNWIGECEPGRLLKVGTTANKALAPFKDKTKDREFVKVLHEEK